MTSEKTRTDFLHILARLIACVVLLITICCPSAFAERRVDSDGYVINDSLSMEVPGTWEFSEQFFFLDRDMTEDVGDTKPWSEKDRELVRARLRYIHHRWPALFTNLGGKICLYRADKLKAPGKKDSSYSSVVASTNFRAITLSNLFFERLDKEEVSTLIHELVHVIDTGSAVSYSRAWVEFVGSDSLEASRKEPNPKADYAEKLAAYLTDYLTSSSPTRSDEFNEKIYTPFFATRNDALIRYSSIYRAGVKAMIDRDFTSGIPLLERASFENKFSPMPCLHLACAYYFELRLSDALKAAEFAERQFKALGLGFENQDLFYLGTMKAKIYLKLNQTVNAGALVEKLMKVDPKNENVISLTKRVQEQRSKAPR